MYLSGDAEADELLARDPFALLIGMVLDQQVPLERAFAAPAALKERLGQLDPQRIAAMNLGELEGAFAQKPALHRFPSSMAARVQQVALVLVERYGGDAAALWSDAPDGATLLQRLRALPGFGAQKAKIFLALLAKQLGVTPTGWQEACAPYGESGAFYSVADIDSAESLARVREHKREMKAAAKSVARLESSGTLPRRVRR